MNHRSAEKLRFETAHFEGFRFTLLVIKTEQMQQPMSEKQIQLLAKRITVLFGLRNRAIEGDHHVAQPPGGNFTRPSHGPGEIAKIRGGKLRKREHISSFVFSTPVAVESADMRIIREQDRKFSFF